MIEIIVERGPSKDGATRSKVTAGAWTCFGLEDTVREVPGQPVDQWKVHGQTAIPSGTYKLAYNFSNRFARQMIQILDVPGFAGVRIHNGKGPESTEGCLLVSMTPTFDYNKDAMHYLERLVKEAVENAELATITFKDAP